MMLSIIIPFFGNAEKDLLNDCLSSVRSHQQLTEGEDYEIILVTDGSKGLGGARNLGVAQAKGEYVMFLDADDELAYEGLKPCLNILEEYLPDIMSVDFSAGERVPQTVSDQMCANGKEFVRKHNFTGSACRHFFRLHFLKKNKLTFAENCMHEDEDFTLKAYCLARRTMISDYPLYMYKLRANSLMNDSSTEACSKRISDFCSMLLRVQQIVKKHPDALRRLRFLTLDCFTRMRREEISKAERQKVVDTLRKAGLFPIAKAPYGIKYQLARLWVNLRNK